MRAISATPSCPTYRAPPPALVATYNWDAAMRGLTGVAFVRSEITTADITDGLSHTWLVGEKNLEPKHYDTAKRSTTTRGIHRVQLGQPARGQCPMASCPRSPWFGSTALCGLRQSPSGDLASRLCGWSCGKPHLRTGHSCLGRSANRSDGTLHPMQTP